ncbi:hypothetical protein HR060_00960 [Catenovulum sp. SM1970]|uniref:MATE family efflux transporter n=1 Tax=Marinifaba aquimaris TaxID=2741323 RepID=UPI001571F690|nr:MATE family efflux transporter [Marinifaba aquimaris]NTS75420.1 hypothetical protein [Marinifaba aquimaris]
MTTFQQGKNRCAAAAKVDWMVTACPKKVLSKLTTPMLWAISALFATDLLELFFASRLGQLELTALSFTLPLQTIITAMAVALGIVAATKLSHSNYPQKLIPATFIFTLIIGLSLCLAFIWQLKPLLYVFGLEQVYDAEQYYALINEYMMIKLLALPFFLLMMMVFGLLRALGQMKYAAKLLVLFATVQVSLTSALLFTNWFNFDLTPLSLLGIAHLIACITSFAYALLILNKEGLINVTAFKSSAFDFSVFKSLFKLLLPVSAIQLMTPIALSILMVIIARQGSEAVAVYGVILRLEPLALLLPMVLTTSLPIFVGQNWRANNAERIKQALKLAIIISIIWQLVVAAILFWQSASIGANFCRASLISDGISFALKVLPVSYAALAMIYLYVSCSNAIGRPNLGVFISSIRLFIFTIPFAWIGASISGFEGIVVGLAAANLLLGFILLMIPKSIIHRLIKNPVVEVAVKHNKTEQVIKSL